MLKRLLPLTIAATICAVPAAARQVDTPYGPPSPSPARFALNTAQPRAPISEAVSYRKQDDLLTANGIQIVDGSARRPIAPNTVIAVERARGLVDQFGEKKKPMRLLLRVGTNF